MVAHDGEAQHIDAELPGQHLQASLDLAFAMIIVAATHRILPTQVCPSHAAIDAVQDRNLTRIKQLPTSQACHGRTAERSSGLFCGSVHQNRYLSSTRSTILENLQSENDGPQMYCRLRAPSPKVAVPEAFPKVAVPEGLPEGPPYRENGCPRRFRRRTNSVSIELQATVTPQPSA